MECRFKRHVWDAFKQDESRADEIETIHDIFCIFCEGERAKEIARNTDPNLKGYTRLKQIALDISVDNRGTL